MMKGIAHKLAALVKRVPTAAASVFTGRSGALTPEQKARLDAMEKEYQELVRARPKDAAGIFLKKP